MPENGRKWLKHVGHSGHLLIKRLIALDGTFGLKEKKVMKHLVENIYI
jgi:hypothetical protein